MIIKNEKKTVKTPIQTATRRFTPVRAQNLLFSKRVSNAYKTREKYARIPLQDKAKTQSRVFEGIQRQKAQPMAILAKSCACLFSPQFP